MKNYSSLFRWLQLSLALFATALLVRADAAKPPAADGGLQMSVNTSAYCVYAGSPVPAPAPARAKAVKTRATLAASVQLTNRSPHDLTFSFPNDAAAQRRFDFRVFNSEGTEIWSRGGVENDAVETAVAATVRKRSKWSAVVQVPLQIDGEWLTPGLYTVEASLAGEPKIGATTLFEVAVPPPAPQPEVPKNTGIKGQVLSVPGIHVRLDGSVISPTVMPRGIKATVSVQQLLPEGVQTAPFFWQGETTEDGRFQVNTPPGNFRVSVLPNDRTTQGAVPEDASRWVPITGVTPPVSVIAITVRTVNTTVRAGAFSTVELRVGGGIEYEQPRMDGGVKGQVFAPSSNGMVVAPGATVVIEDVSMELHQGDVLNFHPKPRLRFTWMGTTDAEGRFQVNTPPGSYLVFAHQSNADGQVNGDIMPTVISTPLRDFKDAYVTMQFSEVRLDLKPIPVRADTHKVASVSSVEIRVVPVLPPLISRVQVVAEGVVNTGGWSDGQLRLRGMTPDGIIEFDFVAKPPTGIVTQAFAPISAVTTVPQPSSFRGVRVFAQSNSKEALLE